MTRLIPAKASKTMVELLMSRLDELGLDVMGVPWVTSTPEHLLISETVWQHFWPRRKEVNYDTENSTVQKCLDAVGSSLVLESGSQRN